jgi:hypothetical protein
MLDPGGKELLGATSRSLVSGSEVLFAGMASALRGLGYTCSLLASSLSRDRKLSTAFGALDVDPEGSPACVGVTQQKRVFGRQQLGQSDASLTD